MASASQRPKGREGILSTLNVVIRGLDLAKDACGFPPAQAALGLVSILLGMIRDTAGNDQDYVALGFSCADVCNALDRGLKGRRLDDLNASVLGAIEQLTTTVAEIQSKIADQGQRHVVSRGFHSESDKGAIAGWQRDLDRILHIFNTELAINTHMLVADIHRLALAGQEGAVERGQSVRASVPSGELPPPPPRACFGRNDLIETVVGLAENLTPVALIGAGGIGKTSIALEVLHHDRVKERFGDNRRFIRCDKFPPSRAHLLSRLSKVIGAGIENPEDLTPLLPHLSSSKMILFLDNAESILDPAGPDAREIYKVVEELTRFDNICLGVTSRITTVPTQCKRPIIPTLSMESACEIFYGIYDNGGRSDIISDLVRRLDFHALSITLLATVASHNTWDYNRLAREWETQRAQVLRTDYNESLAVTIELSLASPTFHNLTPSPSPTFRRLIASPTFRKLVPSSILQRLAPSARELLEVIAFFPQGIYENHLDWLFPSVPDRNTILDKFCILSLTYRSNGFISMLAPIRDYLGPRNPKSSPLLCATRDHYFDRLSVDINPGLPGFEEARWIESEHVNVEHLLDVCTSADPKKGDVWDACHHFMRHLYWHKPRQTILGSKIEALPDNHPSKSKCLLRLSSLLGLVGNHTEENRLLTHTLRLERQRGDLFRVAQTLGYLSDVNRHLECYEEGVQQAKEALEICERLGDKIGQAYSLNGLAWSLFGGNQFDAAEDAALRGIKLASEADLEFQVCQSHRLLGKIYQSKGSREKAMHHFEKALEIASLSHWSDEPFWIHYSLAELFLGENKFEDATTHIERAKTPAVNDAYKLGCAMEFQALVWYRQGRLEDATSEALSALEVYQKLGAADDVKRCKDHLSEIPISVDSDSTAPGASSNTPPSPTQGTDNRPERLSHS